MRTLIVDDEVLARRGLRVRLAKIEGVSIVGECASGREAVAAIRSLSPDLVFLDVQMPGLDGFGVVEAVGVAHMPTTIFVTAYDTHALRAFDAQALDYLLKPIDDERFSIAVDRARRRIAERKGGVAPGEPDQSERLIVRDRGRVLVLSEREIDWVAAEGDYVRIYANGRGHLLRGTMASMEERLAPPRFARIHRSAIVNVDRIREVRSQGDRDALVVLRDGSRLKLSRHYRANLRDLAGVSSRQAVDSTTDG